MGEVYKATDTRLDRTVAIKVLPEHVAADPDLKQRFEREARTVAALNHPHICTLHDIGNQDGIDFLVMEYLDGETVAQRLEKGALPLDQALQVAIEIADALDKAHRQGIVHRDLKPGNIMLTKAGAKLLDFGLAKLKPPEQAGALSALPTQPANLTQEGSILGTFQYMPPESLEGQEADARTDIFAFGAVVYEMVTGRKAFEGKSQASLIAAIMHVDPPAMSSLQVMSPPALDQIVKTCLAKDPERRWHSTGDIERQLTWIIEGGLQPSVAATALPIPQRVGWRPSLSVAVGGVVLGTIVTAVAVWSVMRSAPGPATRFTVALPSGLSGTPAPLVAFSPDGRTLVYAGSDQLYRRDLGQLGVQAIPNTEGGTTPFFSPNGQWLGFQGQGQTLKKVSLAGGPSVTLSATTVRGASWGPDDTIVFGVANAGLSRVSAAGGEPESITTLEAGETDHTRPDILPDGGAVLFTVWSGSLDTAQIAVVSLETGDRQMLVGGTYPRYAHTGHIVFARTDSLWAVPFDADRLEVTGTAFPVVDGVSVNATNGAAHFALAGDGSLMYLPSRADSSGQHLVWVDRQGREEPLAAQPQPYALPRISPDGTRVALMVQGLNRDLVVYEMTRNTLSRLTFDPVTDSHPVWTPDGVRLAYGSGRESSGTRNLFWRAADGTGGVDRLTTNSNRQVPHAFSPDGQLLVYVETDPEMRQGIGTLSIENEGTTEMLIQTEFIEQNPALSSDGQWMAYQSDESGQFEVLVRPFPNVEDGRWQISSGGGRAPVWAPDSRELFYRDLSGRVLSVPVQTDPTFEPGNAVVLFGVTCPP